MTKRRIGSEKGDERKGRKPRKMVRDSRWSARREKSFDGRHRLKARRGKQRCKYCCEFLKGECIQAK